MTTTLVLLRHGQSTWNLANRFTGWEDVPLTELGVTEALEGAQLMLDAGIEPGVVHTSLLERAVTTANLALQAMGRSWIPTRRSWRLNERHYGALQGLDKKETAEQHGEAQVRLWRRSYSTPPPPVETSDPRYPAHDARYGDLAPDVLPRTEALSHVVERMLPYWYDAIVPDLRQGMCVLVVAHGNSLRALAKHLEGMSEDEIVDFNIPTGVPRVYRLDADLQPREVQYLGDPAAVAARAEAVARQAGGGGKSAQ